MSGDTTFNQNNHDQSQGQQVGNVEGDMNVTQNVGDSAIKLTFQPALDEAKALPEAEAAIVAPLVEEFEAKFGFAEILAEGGELPAPTEEDRGLMAGIFEKISEHKGIATTIARTIKTVYPPASGWAELAADVLGGISNLADLGEEVLRA